MDRIERSAVPAGQGPEPESDALLMPEISCDACNGGGRVIEIRKDANRNEHRIERDCALCRGTGMRKAGA